MTPSIPERAWLTVRGQDWWAYKIPPLLIVGFTGVLLFEGGAPAWTRLGIGLAAIVMVAIFGYVLNDLCDIDADRVAGRANRMARIGPAGRAAGVVVPTACALLLTWSTGDRLLIVLIAINLGLPTVYSVAPVRLKGRGSWGALADALGVHAVPAAIVAWASTGTAGAGPFIAASVGWAFLLGARGILLHQVADRDSDARAGVMTLGRRLGPILARRLVLFGIFPAELACLAIVLGPVLLTARVAAAFAVVGIAIDLWRRFRGWRLPLFDPPATSDERLIPVLSNELYEIWLPLGLALQIAVDAPGLAWIPAAMVLVFQRNYRARLSDLPRLVRAGDSDRARSQLAGPRVILAATSWTVNGVNVFSANLARELAAAGVPAEVLLTEENSHLATTRERPMPRPDKVAFCELPTDEFGGWGDHWGSLVRYLEDAAPCIYIPNSDWRHSSVCPQLSNRVVVVGVVHSDDPLHYDHVRRLGPYWNAVVAVSRAVAERALAVCPSIHDRLTTIPIGVRIPAVLPARPPSTDRLRVVYHGILKQHQKRVLDLPRIAQAAVDLGVPIALTIAGAGPEEEALRAAARPLVEQGVITFAGVRSPDDMPALLERHDVYLLASEFEGMPNALIEAMGRGCVPVVSRMTSGIPELVADGINGLLAPVGDAPAFAAALQRLWQAPELRAALSTRAFHTVSSGRYRVEDMAAAYQEVFARALADARAGRFTRPRGALSHPPREVAGVSLFPVDLPHEVPNVGAFPSAEDADDYQKHVADIGRPRRISARRRTSADVDLAAMPLDGVSVFVGTPVWTANGINHLGEDLVRGFCKAGLQARLLLTEEVTGLVQIDAPRMARPTDIPVEELHVAEPENWGARWGRLTGMLEAAAPSIYLPGYDWRHASVSPALSGRVVVVGSVHDGDAKYLEQAARLGTAWNRIVATGRQSGRRLREQMPALMDRIRLIPHGLTVPAARPARPASAAGRARLLLASLHGDRDPGERWAAAVAGQLAGRDRWEVVAVDPGESVEPWLASHGVRVLRRLNRQAWINECRAAWFVLAPWLTSDTARAVIEGMGQGCIPVVAHAAPDSPHRIDATVGFVEDGTDAADTVRRLMTLAADAARLEGMSGLAHAAARQGGFYDDQMIAAYLDLFRRCLAEAAAGHFRRPRRGITPPPPEVDGTSIFPVQLGFKTRDGMFPSQADAERYREEMRAASTPVRASAGAAAR